VQSHRAEYIVDAPRQKVWRALHPPAPPGEPARPRVIEYPGGRIEVLFEGDDAGEGLVRMCTFPVPRLIGGRARSWECIVEARENELSHYMAVGKPLWSRAEGTQTYEDTPEGGTKVTFTETYEVLSKLTKPLEAYVHRFISKHNDETIEKYLGSIGSVRRIA
jgi:hypothetical protein